MPQPYIKWMVPSSMISPFGSSIVAVAAAYGWSADLTNDEILAALGNLHLTRQASVLDEKAQGENGDEHAAVDLVDQVHGGASQ
jgi:hypothetical protein